MRKSLIITVVITLLCLCGCEAVVTVPESPEPTKASEMLLTTTAAEESTDMFRFDRLPENMSTMDARSVRTELSKIRDVANVISADMAKVLDKNRQPVERRDEAR